MRCQRNFQIDLYSVQEDNNSRHFKMKSVSVPSILRVGLLICSISTAVAQELVDAGCYSSSEPLKDQGLYTFQSSGYCKDLCVKLSKPVMALSKGSNCYCGDYIPVASSKVSDSKCNTKCNGYPQETCESIHCPDFFLRCGLILQRWRPGLLRSQIDRIGPCCWELQTRLKFN